MPRCVAPLHGHRASGGRVVFNGKGYKDRPVTVRCGQCVGCRLQRAQDWTLRLVHESQMHEKSCFVTLTYAPENLPPDGSLQVKDFQRFMKRLRKKHGKLRYFHCGEYGDENLRPHYHAILFGEDFRLGAELLKSEPYPLWTQKGLEETWSQGFVVVGGVNYSTAAYCARYAMKKRTGPAAKERYARVDPTTGETWYVRPEYITMSLKPGIGATWLEKFSGDVYPSDEVIHDGRQYRPPKFYDRSLEEKDLEELKTKRVRRAKKYTADSTPERLRAHERIYEQRERGRKRAV